MNSFSSEGIVLKRKNIGEADKLVTLFTKNRGKLKTLAKGVRKVNSRRAGNLEIINHVKIFLHETKSWPILTEVETKSIFLGIKEDLSKLSLVYLMFELVDQLLTEEQESPLVFDLLISTLNSINSESNLEKAKVLVSNFQLKLLSQVGYLPQLQNCVVCNERLLPETNFLSPHLGGLVDKKCNQQVILSRSLSLDAIKALRFLARTEMKEIVRLTLEKKLLKEVFDTLNFYTVYFLEKDLNSPRFARAVEKFYN
jgi:DNA repair protein RecO (recombination protein O)